MMTNEQKVEAYKMLLDGATYREVGEKFGLTHQRIHQMFPGVNRRGRNFKCIYPNIGRWIVESRITQPVFGEMLDVSINTIHHYLSGEREPNKKTIDKILEVTGMTYEEAFKQ